MIYLGLDYGSKRLGMAISDQSGTIATPLGMIKYTDDKQLMASLKEIIETKKIDVIILGFPKNMDNSIGIRAETVLAFKKKIEATFKIKVILEDERLTSKRASSILIQADMSRRKRKEVIDKLAANIILQSYLDKKKGKQNG